ncbi:MAG: SOS response-associated peptidase [Verrucomicrobiae bacterium]|nr:SOS response-associated peptidase [Verrucomicrobiae bacterium]
MTLQGRTVVQDELAEVRIQLRSLQPRFNIAPGQTAPVFRIEEGSLKVATLRWGLVPSWAKDEKFAFQCINARAETVATKPAFRSAFRRRRCLVPADGFYEWEVAAEGKRPWRFTRPDGAVFEFAGLWEAWRDPAGDGAPIETFTVLTTTPNSLAARVHDRMPVILSGPGAHTWLDPDASPDALLSLLKPAPDPLLTVSRVSTYVNNSRHEGPSCIEPESG